LRALPSFPTRRSSDLRGRRYSGLQKPRPPGLLAAASNRRAPPTLACMGATGLRHALGVVHALVRLAAGGGFRSLFRAIWRNAHRSEEHTSELQSLAYL